MKTIRVLSFLGVCLLLTAASAVAQTHPSSTSTVTFIGTTHLHSGTAPQHRPTNFLRKDIDAEVSFDIPGENGDNRPAGSLAASRLVHFMVILFGGISFTVAFGRLAAGVSVTSHYSRLLPRWTVWFGLVIAAAGELCSLSLVALAAAPLIPIVRSCGFIWLVAVGAALPKRIRADDASPGNSRT